MFFFFFFWVKNFKWTLLQSLKQLEKSLIGIIEFQNYKTKNQLRYLLKDDLY